MRNKTVITSLAGFVLLWLPVSAEVNYDAEIKPFLKDFCIRCHGPEKQKGDRRYDSLKADFESRNSVILWREIMEQLQLEEMPPKKPFPESTERKKVIDWIGGNLKKISAAQLVSKNGTVMRRLSHQEYTNSLKELFKVDLPNFDLTKGLPQDNIQHGFDTEAKQLKTTPFLLSNYLKIADRFIEKTIPFKKPEIEKTVYSGRKMTKHRDSYLIKVGKDGGFIDFTGRDPGASRSTVNGVKAGADARYKIRITAEAIDRDKNWKDYHAPNPGTPWKLKVIASNEDAGPLKQLNSSDYDVTTLTITEGKKDYEFNAYVRKDHQLVFWWENGGRGNPRFRRVLEKRLKINYDKFAPKNGGNFAVWQKYYDGPRLRVHEIEIDGPYFEQWPPEPVSEIFGKNPPVKPDMNFVKKRISVFASKAWRRPATQQELDPIFSLISKTINVEGYRAVAKGMKAIICSPSFLYHYQNKGKLDDFALASRLSFFLWGTSPDVELLRLAYRKKLSDPKIYNQQVKRLISDPKSSNFIENFSYQWLNLKNAEEMPPDQKKFSRYYQLNVDKHMITETQEFIKFLIRKNMSIYNCLDTNFVMVNEKMAQFYGIKDVKGDEFRPVKLPDDSIRGGLLTQASVLTATSNGVDTSPIVRGVWILENILGTTPPVPPPDVEPLEPDIRGTKTVKDRLRAHREKEACNECHRKIDYLGLSLEKFSPIGLLRSHYDSKRKVKVDPTSEAPNGKVIKNSNDLKKFLMDRKKLFARGLIEKLLAYGTGRKMSYIEQPAIDEMVESLDSKDGFQDLLFEIVNSKVFLYK